MALLPGAAFAQALPLVVGGVAEMGSGLQPDGEGGTNLVRITPFVGVWVQSLGYVRVGYGLWDASETDSSGKSLEV